MNADPHAIALIVVVCVLFAGAEIWNAIWLRRQK